MHTPLNIAHRGASGKGLAPENTFAAFRLALEHGADMVELDVHRTKDGQVVVMHDATLDRTTNQTGAIRDLTLHDLIEADAGDGERIPTLLEALALIRDRAVVLIEIKPDDITDTVMETIMETDAADFTVIQSFHPQVIADARRLLPHVLRSLLIGREGDMIHQAESVGAGIVTPAYTLVTEALIDDVHAHGLDLCTYTVDDESDMLRMIDLDVDGIITNYPNRLKALQSSD